LKNILILLSFCLLLKASYLLLSVFLENGKDNKTLFNEYVSIVKKNDSFWYEKITKEGYSKINQKSDLGFSQGKNFKQSEWAFFPFYPFSIRFCSNVFNLNFNESAFLISIVFSFLSVIGMYWFGLIYYKNQSLAFLNSLVVFCSPFSFYFSMFYTEAIFFALILFSFIAIYYHRLLIVGILLIPLVLVRPNGIIITIPLFFYFLEHNNILTKNKFAWQEILKLKALKHSSVFLIAPLTFIIFCIYQYLMTGYFFAFSIAQQGWYREFTLPFLSFFRSGDFSTQFNSFFTLSVLAYAVIIRKKLPISLNVFIAISLILPLCSGSVMSMTRFVSVVFPMFLLFSEFINKSNYKYLLVFVFTIFHYLSFYSWLINHPISY
jgi:hypothetical protein